MDCNDENSTPEESSNPYANSEEVPRSCSRGNVDAGDLDEETIQKLRGDTIGDTLYSQSFVLKTLLQFSDGKWSEQFEEDLCFMWDMTLEKDVCKFLLDMSYPSLACNVILHRRDDNRFVEIVIGILGNLFCSGLENNMTHEEVSTILTAINYEDHLILIQLMRFIIASLESNKQLLKIVDQEFTEKICFILRNSINNDLLLKTLETAAKLTVDVEEKNYLCRIGLDLFQSSIVAYKTLLSEESGRFEADTKEKLLSVRYMLETITNISTYIDKFENNLLYAEIQKSSKTFLKEVNKILNYFSHEENLLPLTDEVSFVLSAISYIFIQLKLDYLPGILQAVTKILCVIENFKDELQESVESMLEFECYLISSTPCINIKNDLKCMPKQKVKNVLNLIKETNKFEHANLNQILEWYK